VSSPQGASSSLGGVAQTLLLTLHARAREAQRADGLIKDDRAVEIVRRLGDESSHKRLHGHDEVAVILRTREFDRHAREFMARHPDAVIAHLGCGLDTRFERVDDGRVTWYDLDLPEVMDLRRRLIGGEGPRHHFLSGSAFDDGWLHALGPQSSRPLLVLAEGVLPYFKEGMVKSLVVKLRKRFPGAELVCDAHTPFMRRMDNLQLAFARMGARLQWGLKHASDVESWGEGVSLLEEWYYFDRPEPRMKGYLWMRRFPLLGRSTGVFHYRLGSRP
jgi:O-methyltransferase involved in polyketide biosynthesis